MSFHAFDRYSACQQGEANARHGSHEESYCPAMGRHMPGQDITLVPAANDDINLRFTRQRRSHAQPAMETPRIMDACGLMALCALTYAALQILPAVF